MRPRAVIGWWYIYPPQPLTTLRRVPYPSRARVPAHKVRWYRSPHSINHLWGGFTRACSINTVFGSYKGACSRVKTNTSPISSRPLWAPKYYYKNKWINAKSPVYDISDEILLLLWEDCYIFFWWNETLRLLTPLVLFHSPTDGIIHARRLVCF